MSKRESKNNDYILYLQCEYCKIVYKKVVSDVDICYYWTIIDEEDDIIRMRYSSKCYPDADFVDWAKDYLPRNI